MRDRLSRLLRRSPQLIRLEVPVPCAVRLDRLLAAELGISRSAVLRCCEPEPEGACALRRPIRDGQTVRVREVRERERTWPDDRPSSGR